LRRTRLFPPSWPGFEAQALGVDGSAAEKELRETTYAPGVPTIDVLVFGRKNWGKSQLIIRLVNSLNARVLESDDLSERERHNQRELEQRRNDLVASMGATKVPEHFVTSWNPYTEGVLEREPAWRMSDTAVLVLAALLPIASAGAALLRGAGQGASLRVAIAIAIGAVAVALLRLARRFARRDRAAPDVELVLWDVPGEFIWRSQSDAADDRARSAAPQNRAARFFSELVARRAETGAATFAPILIANPLELLAPLDFEAAIPIEQRKAELRERLPDDAGRRLTPEQWLNPHAQHLYRLAAWIDGWVDRQPAPIRSRSLLAVINYWQIASDLLARGDDVRLVHLRLGDADHLLHLDQISSLADGIASVCRGLDVEILRTDAATTRRVDLKPELDGSGWHRCDASYFEEEVGPLPDVAPVSHGRLANPAPEREVAARWLAGYYTTAVARADAAERIQHGAGGEREASAELGAGEREPEGVLEDEMRLSQPELAADRPVLRPIAGTPDERPPSERVVATAQESAAPRVVYGSRGEVRRERFLRLRDLPPSPPRAPREAAAGDAAVAAGVTEPALRALDGSEERARPAPGDAETEPGFDVASRLRRAPEDSM
jgi:hypothetical protein